jgi:predicted RNA-binding Zn ribbon-like protein
VVALATRQRSAPGTKAKAAFTLRLDADRHLRLRLACAMSHRSAQQLVTEALDTFLATLPEVAAMAGHMPAPAAKRS